MKIEKALIIILVLAALSAGCKETLSYNGLPPDLIETESERVLDDTIIYHPVRVDEDGKILPWQSSDPGKAYEDAILRTWEFWKNIETCPNGLKYYMNHQVWREGHDIRGLGGDQLQMALSSWDLLYNFTGDESVIENMQYMADYYLAHSLSGPGSEWPFLPYPYNTDIHSGEYDGDMILGKGYLQPDKAGSLGYELIHLYKKTGREEYLEAAVNIANTMALKVVPGDDENSPWPFKVNALTGETGILSDLAGWYEGMDADIIKDKEKLKKSSYTTFWTSTLGLFDELIRMQRGNITGYRKAFDLTLEWMKNYPAKTNKWGPFFEDVPRWSDTQINAVTYAMYLMDNPEFDTDWKNTVNNIFRWVHNELDNNSFVKYGVIPVNEQTTYRVPGNSHSARQASMELRYWELTGDTAYLENAVRMLSWATYMVDHDGKNYFPDTDVWLTDGYGDYVRHYIRAMASAPELAPGHEDHLLRTSSIVRNIRYQPSAVIYEIFDNNSEDLFRLRTKPDEILVNGIRLREVKDITSEGWVWRALPSGGVLNLKQSLGSRIEIIF